MVRLDKHFLIPAAFFLPMASGASAQSLPTNDALALPQTSLTCEVSRSANPVLATLSYHFEEGDDATDERMIDAEFDSSGAPTALVLLASAVSRKGSVTTEAVAARFAKDERIVGFRMRYTAESRPDGSAAGKQARVPLSDEDKPRIRGLAIWLWAHRCGTASTVPIDRR